MFFFSVDVDKLYTHTHIIAEGIARYVSDLSDKSVTILDDYLVCIQNLMLTILYSGKFRILEFYKFFMKI